MMYAWHHLNVRDAAHSCIHTKRRQKVVQTLRGGDRDTYEKAVLRYVKEDPVCCAVYENSKIVEYNVLLGKVLAVCRFYIECGTLTKSEQQIYMQFQRAHADMLTRSAQLQPDIIQEFVKALEKARTQNLRKSQRPVSSDGCSSRLSSGVFVA